jgi:molybdopterin molybdotransferase
MGVESIEVQRRLRVGLLSTGSELCVSGGQALKHQIHDANRPMLASLLASPRAEIVDGGIVDDDAQFIGKALRVLAAATDVVVGSGGAGDSDTDHAAAAIIAAGGSAETFEIAQRPGKRLVLGRIGELPVIWLPGTTVAAMVGCLLYVRPLLDVRAGRVGRPPAARRAVTNRLAGHRAGRTEFVPASIAAASGDGCLVVEPVASAGPASLGALLSAEGMMEIPADIVALGDARHEVLFHPFADAFSH